MSLTTSQFNELMREYDRRQSAREAEISRRRKELYGAEPRLWSLDEDIRSAHIQKARCEIAGEDTDPISENISGLMREREHLFEEMRLVHGQAYPEDYLDVPYVCPDCQDRGIVDGKKCHCFKKAESELLFASSNLDKRLCLDFSAFRLDIYDDREKDAAGRTCADYARALLSDAKALLASFPAPTSFYIYGNTGTGKTLFSCCLASEIIRLGYSAIFIKAPDFIDLCYQRFEDPEGEKTAMYNSLFECDFLVLDDWGTAFTTRNSSNLLLGLIDARLDAELPTTITSNLSLAELKSSCDDRIFSRIAGSYKAYNFFGLDQRTKPKQITGGKSCQTTN